jgi:hypothetical protein
VLAVGTGKLQVGRAGIDVLREADVLHVCLAGATTTTHVHGSRVREAPAPGEHVDLALVLRIARLPLDSIELDEHVDSHSNSPYLTCNLRVWRLPVQALA